MGADLMFRIRSLFRRQKMETELDQEIEFHIEHETAKLIRSGVPEAEARRRARLAFGFREHFKDECREARGTGWFDSFFRDLAFGLRLLRRTPAFTAVAVLSLALGIGANTAIFQLLDAVRLRSLPVQSPGQLAMVRIGGDGPTGNFTSRFGHLSAAQWELIRARQQAFSNFAVWSPRPINLANGGEVRPAEGMLVSGSFFRTLGVMALRGRTLDDADDRKGCGTPAAVISHAFWQREFGAAPDAIGRNLSIDGHAFTIVGITPASFFGVEVGRSYDVAVPLCAEDQLNGIRSQLSVRRDNYWLASIGRLRSGWTLERADAHLRTISPGVFADTLPKDTDAKRYKAMTLGARPVGKGFSWLRVNYENSLTLLLGSAGLVLLIACGNLTNLLLARASARTHEMAVRVALGASKERLVRQLLAESLLLALLGASFGLLIATTVSHALVSFLTTGDDPVSLDIGLDWRVLSFSLGVALLTCVLFGLAPALRAVRVRGGTAPVAARSVTANRERSLFRNALVAAQVALSLVLVAGAFLFGRSLFNLVSADVGFRAEHVLITSVDTRRLGFEGERLNTLFRDLLIALRATPGVTNAAESTIVPMSGWASTFSMTLDSGQRLESRISPVSSGYFATLGTPLLAGRDFGPQDDARAPMVAIVNEAFARKYFNGENPVGRSMRSPKDDKQMCRIVGLVRNTKYGQLQETFAPIVFFASAQLSSVSSYTRYVVRSPLPMREATVALRQAIASVSPAIDIEFTRLDNQVRDSVTRERLLAVLAGGFGALAGLLAAVGLYGVLAYSVAMRRNEIGIRMALGADRGNIVGMVLSEAGWMLTCGIAAGLGIALVAGRAATSLLYGLAPNEPLTLVAAVAALALVGIASAWIPARQAASLDPLTALRQD